MVMEIDSWKLAKQLVDEFGDVVANQAATRAAVLTRLFFQTACRLGSLD